MLSIFQQEHQYADYQWQFMIQFKQLSTWFYFSLMPVDDLFAAYL